MQNGDGSRGRQGLEVVEGVLVKGGCMINMRDPNSGQHWICRGATLDEAMAATPEAVEGNGPWKLSGWIGRAAHGQDWPRCLPFAPKESGRLA